MERDIGARDIRDRDIGERDIGERNIMENDIRETVATCRVNQQLLIHIHMKGVPGCLSFSWRWHHRARFLRSQNPQILKPTEGVSLQRLWSWVSVRGLWR